jgi:mono/diheme cytochrome c family protein
LLSTALVLGLLVTTQQSCYYDNEVYLYGSPPCDTSAVTYALSIEPVITARCFPCHKADVGDGGVVVEGYDALLAYVSDGSLLCVVKHEAGCSAMPKNSSKLTDCQISQLETWINQGAPNN